MAPRPRCSVELKEPAVRLAQESDRPITHTARDLGVHPGSLRLWVRQAEADQGSRPGRATSAELEELKALRKEVVRIWMPPTWLTPDL